MTHPIAFAVILFALVCQVIAVKNIMLPRLHVEDCDKAYYRFQQVKEFALLLLLGFCLWGIATYE